MTNFISAILLIVTGVIVTDVEAEICHPANSIESITIPVVPDKKESFNYKYRYLKGKPGEPVVIFLPGGPGQSSIGIGDPRYNTSYGFIQTDPRGLGCNDDVRIPLHAIGTESMATDILSLIRHLKLEQYILYGVSYGTLLATKIAFESERAGLPSPRALVLEGVLGKSFSPGEAEINYTRAWERVKVLLPDNVRQKISSNPLPLGISESQWGTWLKGMLNFGKLPRTSFSLVTLLEAVNGPQVEQDSLKKMIEDAGVPSDKELEVYKQIACREIYEDSFWSKLVNGNIISDYSSGDLCGDVKTTQPFDVKTWPFRGSIYYFSGRLDPATPPYMAKYHFESQPLAKKFFVEVHEGGHNSLKVNLSDCAEGIWAKILRSENLQETLMKCELETSVLVNQVVAF